MRGIGFLAEFRARDQGKAGLVTACGFEACAGEQEADEQAPQTPGPVIEDTVSQ